MPLNFSSESYLVYNKFVYGTADPFRAAGLEKLEYPLDQGVKVNMIYGDRDYRCPWIGAEKFSVAANWSEADPFRSAGYANRESRGEERRPARRAFFCHLEILVTCLLAYRLRTSTLSLPETSSRRSEHLSSTTRAASSSQSSSQVAAVEFAIGNSVKVINLGPGAIA